jgi:prophage antirepressor-like protein
LDELILVKSERFGELECDIYQDADNEFFMTANQLCDCLGEPRSTFDSRISRNDFLKGEQFSTSCKMQGVNGKEYDTRIFNEDGIYEITMLSNSEKAKEFRAWIRQLLKALRKNEYKLVPITEYQRLIAESRLLNAQVRKSREYSRLADLYRGTDYAKVLDSYASEVLAGERILPLPKAERRTYSATEIGERLGITAHKVGILANKNNFKTDEYGVWVHDKSPHSNKQVQSFRYYEEIIPAIIELL